MAAYTYQAKLPQRAMSTGLVMHTACLLFCVPSNVHMYVVSPTRLAAELLGRSAADAAPRTF